MMQLTYFPVKREYAFVDDPSTLKPVPLGLDRELWFVSKEDAIGCVIDAGYFFDSESNMALEH